MQLSPSQQQFLSLRLEVLCHREIDLRYSSLKGLNPERNEKSWGKARSRREDSWTL